MFYVTEFLGGVMAFCLYRRTILSSQKSGLRMQLVTNRCYLSPQSLYVVISSTRV